MRLTYRIDRRIGNKFRGLFDLLGQVLPDSDLPLQRVEIQSRTNVPVPDERDVILGRARVQAEPPLAAGGARRLQVRRTGELA